jgi:hypothetical protein
MVTFFRPDFDFATGFLRKLLLPNRWLTIINDKSQIAESQLTFGPLGPKLGFLVQ